MGFLERAKSKLDQRLRDKVASIEEMQQGYPEKLTTETRLGRINERMARFAKRAIGDSSSPISLPHVLDRPSTEGQEWNRISIGHSKEGTVELGSNKFPLVSGYFVGTPASGRTANVLHLTDHFIRYRENWMVYNIDIRGTSVSRYLKTPKGEQPMFPSARTLEQAVHLLAMAEKEISRRVNEPNQSNTNRDAGIAIIIEDANDFEPSSEKNQSKKDKVLRKEIMRRIEKISLSTNESFPVIVVINANNVTSPSWDFMKHKAPSIHVAFGGSESDSVSSAIQSTPEYEIPEIPGRGYIEYVASPGSTYGEEFQGYQHPALVQDGNDAEPNDGEQQ